MSLYFTVIIPTYKDTERLIKCLECLAAQDYPNNLFEVVICNNYPQKEITFLSDRFIELNLKFIDITEPGSYRARNEGIVIAKGDYIAFTDADCIPDIYWLKNASVHLASGIQRLAGRIELFLVDGTRLRLAGVLDLALGFDQVTNVKHGSSVTANLFVERELFDSVGLFNAALLSGGDHEWNKRASTLGIGIEYGANVKVRHAARNSHEEFMKKVIRVNKGIADIRNIRKSAILRLDFIARSFFPRHPKILIKLFKTFPDYPFLCIRAYFYLYICLIKARLIIVRDLV